jgi:hypothetical protein
LGRLDNVHEGGEADERAREDEHQESDKLRVNAGESSGFGVRSDSINEATCGDVFEDEQKYDEQQQGYRNEKQLTGFLREAKPLEVVGKIDELALAREAETFAQDDHCGKCDDNGRETKASDEKAVESALQCADDDRSDENQWNGPTGSGEKSGADAANRKLGADRDVDLAANDDESDAASDDESGCFASETGEKWLGRKESWREKGESEEQEQERGGDGDFAEVAL